MVIQMKKKAGRFASVQKNIYQVKLSFNTDTGEISAGSFVFDQGLTLKESKKDWQENRKEYQEQATRIMARHYAFYRSIFNEEYVTSGSILTCSNSDSTITIQLPEDHGVIAANGKPLLTCKDCEVGTHFEDFGICKCKPEIYIQLGHHPSELSGVEQKDGKGKYKCFPILSHDWITKNQDFMIAVHDWEAHEAALEKDAFLVCQYGGYITIAEVPDESEEERLSDDTSEVSTEKDREEIHISWLKCYKGQPDGEGTIVEYDKEERENLKDEGSSIDWYSFENQTKKNPNAEEKLQGMDFISNNGILVDQFDCYWITLGPGVFIKNYPENGKCQISEFEKYIGCRVDVVLKKIEEDTYVYFECIWSGNIKEHTYNNGIFQTGKPYPEAYWGKQTYINGVTVDTYEPPADYKNGSIVEFTGKNPGNSTDLSKYVVEYLIVYNTVG